MTSEVKHLNNDDFWSSNFKKFYGKDNHDAMKRVRLKILKWDKVTPESIERDKSP